MYRLRWVFYYRDGKIKRGVWNGASPHRCDMAAFQSKNGLVLAAIEGETIEGETKKLYLLEGDKYVSAAWERIVSIPLMGGDQTVRSFGKLYGLSFYTPEEKITVNIHGQIKKRALNEREKLFKNFEEHKQ